ncbi:nucleotide sugar dehydrogenase [Saccharopolyspora erythraea NRRL 2338]|uniref:UDP-glucose/GDP-mannose dehydrogenase n=2 Tax=Saccharopolyspora erythraea TaxID=1836 RepID=A4FEK3_SACEN|nr:nucleotide sugar dehydrogenase [Saccharopolyspora erythraea]EQD82837.1 UDP-N-acetyl-D-glucosamine dehydrogenase [Saccharopolyspora erythraea D]PFG96203.1 nucleotide sugar dehydrogenase [Saccharopolyspora erythraea NRRL 2338]QRK92731.1 nucleotide sugar dehydrogenase [Saccharopolyspora erythraea]CAM02478.1 putative UDP-glucose/GDP-mannose dehydrogenase [Saccharopolyspora erythraea NRRL 2338]
MADVDLVVVGLGYVGLPLARRACEEGLSVRGLDVRAEVAEGLNDGRSHVDDVPDSAVAGMRAAGFAATTDTAVISRAEAVVLCVPTGLTADGEPDLGSVRAAARAAAPHLRPGMLVVLESTSYPGTTEEVVRPILEAGSGLRVGEDFHLAYSPERIDPGNKRFGLRNTPKVVSGCTPLCAKSAVAFYGRFVDTLVVSRGTREAEMAKLLENTYRYVNIALVNEVALFCDKVGIDVWDVMHCAATKPFGFAPFAPGPGVGGHCIPVDPLYLSSKAEAEGFTFDMLAAARWINGRMPGHVVDRAVSMLAGMGKSVRGAEVLLLGVAYKPDISDTRETPALPVARELLARAASVTYHDPHVTGFAVDDVELPRAEELSAALRNCDLAILLQDHSSYDHAVLAAAECVLLDTRGQVAGERVTLL